MVRKIGILLGAVALGALVTSCGDDESEVPLPPTSETGTPTPTPSATSTTPLAFSLTQDFAAASTNANYISAFFTATGGTGEVFSSASRVNGGSGMDFVASPDTATFSFPDLTSAIVFSAADFVSVSTTERRYSRSNESLSMFLPFTNIMRVTYERSGQPFTSDTTPGTLRSQRVALFFNPVTTTTAIDSDLTYSGAVQVVGGESGVTSPGVVSAPDVTFTVDANGADGEDSVLGAIRIFRTVNGAQELVTTLNIERTAMTSNAILLANGGFAGTLTDTANGFSGNYGGVLAGPNREEMLITFSVTSTTAGDNTRFVGSFIGRLQ